MKRRDEKVDKRISILLRGPIASPHPNTLIVLANIFRRNNSSRVISVETMKTRLSTLAFQLRHAFSP